MTNKLYQFKQRHQVENRSVVVLTVIGMHQATPSVEDLRWLYTIIDGTTIWMQLDEIISFNVDRCKYVRLVECMGTF